MIRASALSEKEGSGHKRSLRGDVDVADAVQMDSVSSMPCSASEFEDYVLCKAFDVISGDGSYKRYVFRCAENEEPWALRLHASVSRVSSVVRELHALVERIRNLGSPLSRVCTEVVTAMHAPVRLVSSESICCLTQTQVVNCVDVSRATKTELPVTVHPKFHYFVLMLYYTHRLEHVVRSMTKSWLALTMAQKPSSLGEKGEDERKKRRKGVVEPENELSVADLAKRFSDQKEMIRDMHKAFVRGHAHVTRSLQHFLCHEAV